MISSVGDSAALQTGAWQPRPLIRRTLVAGLLLVLFLELAFSVRYQSQTFDEGFHLLAGYRYWQCRDFATNPEHPPLVKFVAAVPIYFSSLPPPSGICGVEANTKGDTYVLGNSYYYNQGLNADAVLFRARMGAAVFSIVLALACYFCANEFFGATAGLIALAVIVFEPNLLANGALITTDVGVSAFMLAAVFAMYRYGRCPSWQRILVVGLMTGLTFACKHSGVLLVPILVIVGLGEIALFPRREDFRQRSVSTALLRRTVALAAIFAIGVAVLWTVYGWRYSGRPNGHAMSIPLAQFLVDVREQGTHGLLVDYAIPWIARAHLLPEAYLYGFVDVLNVSDPGQPPFVLGTLYPHGKWFYFPAAFVVKSTLGFLALVAIVLFAVPWRGAGLGRQFFYLAVPPFVILLVSMTSGLNIGYRHILPMVGFLCVLIGGGAAYLLSQRRAWGWVAMLLLVAHAVSSLQAFPNYLPYANEAWGGPSQAYRYLTDANVDWGNGVLQLKRYLAEKGIQDCWLAYDGAVDLNYYGIPCRVLPANAFTVSDPPPLRAKGVFIISDLSWSGIEWETQELNPYRDFQRVQPVDNIAGGLLVYNGEFDLTGAAAVSHIARAQASMESNPKQSVAEAHEAVALTPSSVRAHLTLGRALARTGHPDEARAELQHALALASVEPAWYPIQMAAAHDELRRLPGGTPLEAR